MVVFTVAMAGLATAQDKAPQSGIVDTPAVAGEKADAKLRGNRAGEERQFEIAPGVKMTFCWCPRGEFVMGSPKYEEGRDSTREDQAKVTLTRGFWIAKTELTQAQWEAVMGNNPAVQKGANRPAVGVSWEDAQKFMEKINANLGHADGGKMALPTEAQFEYAARAGEVGMYPGGKLDEVAWHAGNSNYTQPVGTKKANAWGLHDMNGNAWEWVQDCYDTELPGGTDPIATERGLDRVIRGGCWLKNAAYCRLATRSYRWLGASQCNSITIRIVRNSWPVAVSQPANIDPEINGLNVTRITYKDSSIEKSFEQTDASTWTSGKDVYTEVKRNEWNVHLRRTGEVDARVQIDLAAKTVVFRGQEPKVMNAILSGSKQLPDAVKAAIEKALQSSADAARAEAEKAINNSIGMKMVPIPKGKFQMGSGVQEEGYRYKEPSHEVTITRDYYMGDTEVTQAQFLQVMGRNPSYFQGDQAKDVDSSTLPVEMVTWDEAVEFCKKLSALPEEKAAGRVYRLPTEAEWEYACRAGSSAPFGFGGLELQDDYGWFSSNSQGKTHPVGKKAPNALGLYDMHGNVSEWCSDWGGDYPDRAVSDPNGPKEGTSRMNRGGTWLYPAVLCKSGCRMNGFPPSTTRMDYLGFRVALSSPEIRK